MQVFAIFRVCVCVCSVVYGSVWNKHKKKADVLEREGSTREKRKTRILPQMLALGELNIRYPFNLPQTGSIAGSSESSTDSQLMADCGGSFPSVKLLELAV